MRPQAHLMVRGDDHRDAYGVASQTTAELERTRRDLKANLALVAHRSPARVPILSHMNAVVTELDRRSRIRHAGREG